MVNVKSKKYIELEKVKQDIVDNLKCELKDNSTSIVFGKGSEDAQVLFIGEAPGAKEDLQGVPFVGRAGKQLDKLLNKISLSIDDVYIANILKYRPPKNRDPKINEIISHTPYLIEQIKIIKPEIIATLGNFSSKFILALNAFNPDEESLQEFFEKRLKKEMKNILGISEIHGKEHIVKFDGVEFKVIPIYHPAAMMYRPSIRGDFEADFEFIAGIIGSEVKKEEVQKKLV